MNFRALYQNRVGPMSSTLAEVTNSPSKSDLGLKRKSDANEDEENYASGEEGTDELWSAAQV